MRAASRQERGPEWIDRLPVTITPNEFHNLVHARVSYRSTPAPASLAPGTRPQTASADRDAPFESKYSKEQYLRVYKKLACSPKPSSGWLGSSWQRRRAESILDHARPADGLVADAVVTSTSETARGLQTNERSPTEPELGSGPPNAYLLELQARRRDELRKSREKQEERQRLQEEQDRSHNKLLQAKKAKVEARDRQRIIERDQAKAELESTGREMQELRRQADRIRAKLDHIKGAKHNAVKLLKRQMAVPAESTAVPHVGVETDKVAQRRDSWSADVDKWHVEAWMKPRAPFSQGNLIDRLFGCLQGASMPPSDDEGLKRKREMQGSGADGSKACGKLPRTEVVAIHSAATHSVGGVAGSRKPVAPMQGMSGVRGKSHPLSPTVEAAADPAHMVPLPPPGPVTPHVDLPPEPIRPGGSAWSPPHDVSTDRSSVEVLPAPPPGKPPPRPAWQSVRAPNLHNLPPPIALPSPGDLPRPPPSFMARSEASKNRSSNSNLPGPP